MKGEEERRDRWWREKRKEERIGEGRRGKKKEMAKNKDER